mmetsp:Transcript_17345/g.35411  ORF Transcript_17345/g.35411 Transcript_17345/m.35411 type:complete len:185 (-) Transcript_17345:131-685(-)
MAGLGNGNRSRPHAVDGLGAAKVHKLWGCLEKESMSEDSWARLCARLGEEPTSIEITESSSAGSAAAPPQDDPQSPEERRDGEVAEDPALATLGSQLHPTGECKPCRFFREGKTCTNGAQCKFCHYHPDVNIKRPGMKMRRAMAKRAAREEAQQAALQAASQAGGATTAASSGGLPACGTRLSL